MKIFNLFLILIMLACYSGICNSSATPAYSVLKTESCHKMDNHNSSQNSSYIVQSSNHQESVSPVCCFDSLINAVDDNYVRDFVTLTPTVFNSDHIVANGNRRIKHMSLRGHSPPDLQVLNSTFLI